MTRDVRLFELFDGMKYPKLVLGVSVILLLLLELGIWVAVSNQSGLKSRVVITDANGAKIHESTGTGLTAYEKMQFENNYGPLRNYNSHVETEFVPFPLRSWVLLAIGVPMGLILLMAFLVQVWLLLLNGGPRKPGDDGLQDSGKNRFDSFLSASRNFSILHVGFVIVLTMLILWLVPSFIGDVAKSCFGAVHDYPWFFLGVSAFIGGMLAWIIYLRYKLSKQMLDNQLEIEKYRLKTQLLAHDPTPQLLTSGAHTTEEVIAQVLDARDS